MIIATNVRNYVQYKAQFDSYFYNKVIKENNTFDLSHIQYNFIT
jgi:hypothetical protein